MLRAGIHIALHFVVPGALAAGLRARGLAWRRPLLLMLAGLLIDLDHLWATPVYAPGRCSLDVHPLHQPVWWLAYLLLLAWTPTRWLGMGLIIHIALDGMDCAGMKWGL